MATNSRTQGIQDLLGFPFRDKRWKTKLLIAAVVGLAGYIIPIIPGIFVAGYAGMIMRRIIRDKGDAYLPEWDNLNEIFMLGLKLTGALFVYFLPVAGVFLLSYGAMIVPAIASGFVDPANTKAIGPALALTFGGMFGGMAMFGLTLILSLLYGVAAPPMLGHVVATGSFGAAFQVRKWWEILRANAGGFAVAFILFAGLYGGMILVMQGLYLTVVLCLLIPVAMALTGTYLMVISSVVFAEAYAEGAGRIEAATGQRPVAPEARPA